MKAIVPYWPLFDISGVILHLVVIAFFMAPTILLPIFFEY